MSKKIISLLLVVMLAASVMTVSVVSGSAATGGATWYVRGDFNSWGVSDSYKMTDEDGDGVFELKNVAINNGQGFKVAANGEWSESYPQSNYIVNDGDGIYDITFNTSTNEVTATKQGSEPTEDYYIVAGDNADIFGTVWDAANEDNKMTEIFDGFYKITYISTWTTNHTVALKVVKNGNWNTAYPSANYKFVVTGPGEFYVSFNKATGIVSAGSDNGIISPYVEPSYTVYFKNTDSWDDVKVYYWNNGPQWPGNDTTFICNDSDGYGIYKAEVPASVTGIIFNNNNKDKQTPDIWQGIADGVMFAADGNAIANPAFITGHTISLKDEIAVNFYANINDADNLTATYSYGTNGYSVEADAVITDTTENNANKKITCLVNARSMTDDINLVVKSGNDPILADSYQIYKYAGDLANADAKYKALMCAMLNYGGAVQEFFGYNTDNKASSYIAQVDSDWDEADYAPTQKLELGGEYNSTVRSADIAEKFTNIGLTYNGATMVTTGKTAFRLFFSGSNHPNAVYTLDPTEDGTVLEWKNSKTASRGKYIEINGISAKNIFKDYNITFGSGDNAIEFRYNAADYFNFAFDNEDVKLHDLMVAMLIYSGAANELDTNTEN